MGKNVIISVFDKTNLDVIAKYLVEKKFTIYSTGGTSKFLKTIKIPHIEISKYTKQKEILGGRVKTLHPKIFGGLLGTNTNEHKNELKKQKIVEFDLLIVNLYPFKETVKNEKNKSKIIEMIDIGGHSLIRAAVKNYERTIPLIEPSDYDHFIKNSPLKRLSKKKLAIKAIDHITKYDLEISNWFKGKSLTMYPLRYGENPQQKASAIIDKKKFSQISGDKKLSYNNLLDVDAGVNLTYGFKTKNSICTIIKHGTPCGASLKKDQSESYLNALAGDPLSSFGGVIAFNQRLKKQTAELLIKNFYEVVTAPEFEKGALKLLRGKKNLRVIRVKKSIRKIEERSFFGGTLVQDVNSTISSVEEINGKNKLDKEKLGFFINILKNIKSNAIALFNRDSLISQSGGQTSRVDALQICLNKLKYKDKTKKIETLFLFSDAFFPFTDSLSIIQKQKCQIDIYAPMGSKSDSKIINYVKKNKLKFFKLSERHFKH